MENTFLEALQALGVNIAIGGVPVLIGTYVTVQALKYAKLIVTSDHSRLANVIVAAIYGLLFASLELFPAAAPVATTLYVSLIGSVGAAIAYNKLSEAGDKSPQTPEG